jgi:hypothetical protein
LRFLAGEAGRPRAASRPAGLSEQNFRVEIEIIAYFKQLGLGPT